MSLFSELKRRNVFRVAGVYAVVGWLLVQIAATVEEAIGLPAWFDAVVLSFLVIVFPIALVFAWAFELTPEGIKRTEAVDRGDSITAQTGSKLDVVLIIAFLLFAAAMALPRFLPSDGAAQTPVVAEGSGKPSEATPNEPNDASIAVLPFADLSKAQDQEYFADGISEELLNVLAQVQGMKVAGRTSSFAFKGRNEDLREIGRILNVAHILEGSVRSEGDKVRVTAQLIQVSDGFHLWSETYDRDLTSIFEVQDDIAQQILVAMTERLMVDEAPQLAPAARTDITAYNLFLEARDLIFSRNVEKMQRAQELLDQAVAIDPGYAPAYASRAKAVTLLSDRPGSYGVIPAQRALERALADVEKALALDPNLADAHAVMGLVYSDMGRPDFALSSLRRALELNPNSLDARNWLALRLSYNGRMRDVTEQLKTLTEIDPLYEPGVNNAVIYCRSTGDIDSARRILQRFIDITDDPIARTRMQGSLAALNWDIPGYVRSLESLGDAMNAARSSDLRSTYVDLGAIESVEGRGEILPVYMPFEFYFAGNNDAAVSAAKRAIEEFPDYFVAHTVYIQILSLARRDAELAAYFQSQYDGDLERFAVLLRPSVNVDPPPFEELAQAMRSVGNERVADEALQRWRFTLDIFRAGGDVSDKADRDDAAYWSINGDVDKSLKFLQSAAEKTPFLGLQLFARRAFDSVRDDPRFLAQRAANLQRVNAIREELGLKPLTLAYYDRFKS